MTPSNALSWLDKRGTVSADAQWAAMGSSEALSAAAVPGEELLAPAQSSMFTLPEEDIGPGGTLSADAQWAAMVSAKTLWAATELAAQSSTFTVPVEVIVPEKSTPLADTIRTLLFEEAFAADEELKARRKWLARKDPVACLHQLRRLNRSLLADTKRRLDNHLRLAYALRLQRRWRGKLNPGTVAAAVARNAQTVADDRSRVHAALKWLKRQRLMLRAEARSIASEVLPRQENRALGLRRRLVASEYQREKDENAGAALPRDRRASSLEHPVFKVVRKTQEELLGVEATTRTIQQILAEEFDIMPRRLTAKERRRSVMHSPAGVTAAALAQRRLGGSTVAGPPPGRAWEEGERRRLASEKALAAKRARARSEQEAVEQDKAAVLDAQDRCAQVQAQLDEYRRRPRRSSSAASQRQVTMACGAAPTLAASAASPALAEAAEAAEAAAAQLSGAATGEQLQVALEAKTAELEAKTAELQALTALAAASGVEGVRYEAAAAPRPPQRDASAHSPPRHEAGAVFRPGGLSGWGPHGDTHPELHEQLHAAALHAAAADTYARCPPSVPEAGAEAEAEAEAEATAEEEPGPTLA